MPLDLSKIQALCFDVDGTLRDTDDQYEEKLHPPVLAFLPAGPQKGSPQGCPPGGDGPGYAR